MTTLYPIIKENCQGGVLTAVRYAARLNAGLEYDVAKEFHVSVSLRKFLYDTSKFDFALRVFTEGVDKTSSEIVDLDACVVFHEMDRGGRDRLKIVYEMPVDLAEKCSIDAECIFISRTIINEDLGEYWPHQSGLDRYMGYKIKPTNRQEPPQDLSRDNVDINYMLDDRLIDGVINDLIGNHIRVGTKAELFDSKIWRR